MLVSGVVELFLDVVLRVVCELVVLVWELLRLVWEELELSIIETGGTWEMVGLLLDS